MALAQTRENGGVLFAIVEPEAKEAGTVTADLDAWEMARGAAGDGKVALGRPR
jgi:hypothetical protein